MINDEMDSSEFQQWKYVDDLSIGEVRSSGAPFTIQNTVTELSEWAVENHFHLNRTKCKQLQICFKHTPPEPPALNLEETKILGVWIQDDLKWDKQVKELMTIDQEQEESAFAE